MSGSGVTISMTAIIIAAVPQITQRDRQLEHIVYCVAARGTMIRTFVVLPIASGMIQALVSIASGFELSRIHRSFLMTL